MIDFCSNRNTSDAILDGLFCWLESTSTRDREGLRCLVRLWGAVNLEEEGVGIRDGGELRMDKELLLTLLLVDSFSDLLEERV